MKAEARWSQVREGMGGGEALGEGEHWFKERCHSDERGKGTAKGYPVVKGFIF